MLNGAVLVQLATFVTLDAEAGGIGRTEREVGGMFMAFGAAGFTFQARILKPYNIHHIP